MIQRHARLRRKRQKSQAEARARNRARESLSSDGSLQLVKARVVLDCLAYSMTNRRQATEAEMLMQWADAALIAEMARDLVSQAMLSLDSARPRQHQAAMTDKEVLC